MHHLNSCIAKRLLESEEDWLYEEKWGLGLGAYRLAIVQEQDDYPPSVCWNLIFNLYNPKVMK
jgi:hypothetical protein